MLLPWKPCGTPAAYSRHKRWGEDACDPCKAAWSADNAVRKARDRAVRAAIRNAKAQAIEALIHRHADEHARLYEAALREEMQ